MTIIEQTVKELAAMGWLISDSCKPDKVKGFWVTTGLESATQWTLVHSDEPFSGVTITLGKKRDTATVMGKITKKQGQISGFVNLSEHIKKLLTGQGYFDVYPTSYGVGVVSVLNGNFAEQKARVENMLSALGLDYKSEWSGAEWVFRFRVNKNSSNIQILSKL